MIVETCPHAKFVEYSSDLLQAMNTTSLAERIMDIKQFDLQFDFVQGFIQTGSSLNVIDMELSPQLSALVFSQFRTFLGTSEITGQIARSLKKLVRGFTTEDVRELNPFYFFDVIFVYLDQLESPNRKMMQVIAQKVQSVWYVLNQEKFNLGKLSDLNIKSLTGEVFREFALENFNFTNKDKCKDVFMKIGQTNVNDYSMNSNRILAELYFTQCKFCESVEKCEYESQDISILGILNCFLPAKMLDRISKETLKRNLDQLQSCDFDQSQGKALQSKLGKLEELNFDQIASIRNSLCNIFETSEIEKYLKNSLLRYDRLQLWHLLALQLESGKTFGDQSNSSECVSNIRTLVFIKLKNEDLFKSNCRGTKSDYGFINLIPSDILSQTDIRTMSECQFHRVIEHLSKRNPNKLTQATKQTIFDRVSWTGLETLRPEELIRLRDLLPDFVPAKNISMLNFSNANVVKTLSQSNWTTEQLSAGFEHYLKTNDLTVFKLTPFHLNILGRFLCGFPSNLLFHLNIQLEIFKTDTVFDHLDCPDNALVTDVVSIYHPTLDEMKLTIRPNMLLGLKHLNRITAAQFALIPDKTFEKLDLEVLENFDGIEKLTPKQAQHYQKVIAWSGNVIEFSYILDPFLAGTEFYSQEAADFDTPMLLKYDSTKLDTENAKNTVTSNSLDREDQNNDFSEGEYYSRVIYISINSARGSTLDVKTLFYGFILLFVFVCFNLN